MSPASLGLVCFFSVLVALAEHFVEARPPLSGKLKKENAYAFGEGDWVKTS